MREFWRTTDDGEGVENHFANVVDVDGVAIVIDWTARQFGWDEDGGRPDFPHIRSYADYLRDFGFETSRSVT